MGKRPRASPISASSRAARTVPERGRDVKIGRVGVGVQLGADAGGQGLDLGVQDPQDGDQGEGGPGVDAGVRGRSLPRGAASSRACSTAGSVLPL